MVNTLLAILYTLGSILGFEVFSQCFRVKTELLGYLEVHHNFFHPILYFLINRSHSLVRTLRAVTYLTENSSLNKATGS